MSKSKNGSESAPRRAKKEAKTGAKKSQATKIVGGRVAKKRPAVPTSGQSGYKLKYLVPNPHERAVALCIKKMRHAQIAAIAESVYRKKWAKHRGQAISWVRNALRRLVRANWVKKVERGVYEPTKHGIHELAAVKETAFYRWAVPAEPRKKPGPVAKAKAVKPVAKAVVGHKAKKAVKGANGVGNGKVTVVQQPVPSGVSAVSAAVAAEVAAACPPNAAPKKIKLQKSA